jgi:hypothetical protein
MLRSCFPKALAGPLHVELSLNSSSRPGSIIVHQSTSPISAAKLETTWTDCDGRGQFLEGHLTLLAENGGGRLHVASNK